MPNPSYVNRTYANGSSKSHTLTAGDNRIVIVSGITRTLTMGSSATYGGVAMTLVKAVNMGSWIYLYTWHILETDLPADGANTASVTSGCSGISVVQIQDARQDTYVAEGTYTGEVSWVSDNITTTADNSLIISKACNYQSGGYTHGSGQTEFMDWYCSNGLQHTGTWELKASTGTDTQLHDGKNSSYYNMVTLAYEPAPEAKVSTGFLSMM